MKRWPENEAQLAAVLVAWLKRECWNVHQEVAIGGRCADVVATRAGIVWVIETKRSLGFAVIEQAWEWSDYAHRVAVAVPAPARNSIRRGERVQRWTTDSLGVGILHVSPGVMEGSPGYVTEVQQSKVMRVCRLPRTMREHYIGKMLDTLKVHVADYAEAGSASGRRWSAFRATVDQAVKFVREHPGCSLKELVDSIDHHYSNDSSARQCLSRYVSEGIIDELRFERDGKRYAIYLAEPA